MWWSGGEADDWFWRTAGSGGRATNRAKQGKGTANSAGDIGAEHPEAQKLLAISTIELKRGYSNTDIQELLDHKGKSPFREFIAQAERSAHIANTPYWWLVVQRDRRHPLLLTNANHYDMGYQALTLFDTHQTLTCCRLDIFLERPSIREWYKHEAQRAYLDSNIV